MKICDPQGAVATLAGMSPIVDPAEFAALPELEQRQVIARLVKGARRMAELFPDPPDWTDEQIEHIRRLLPPTSAG